MTDMVCGVSSAIEDRVKNPRLQFSSIIPLQALNQGLVKSELLSVD